VMCMNDASNDVSLWLGNGDGTFQRQIRYGAGKGSLDLSFADFTGDGIADLATYDNTFPPLATNIQIFAGRAQVPVCQPNVGFAGPGPAFLSVCGEPLATGGRADLLAVRVPPGTAAFLGVGVAANPTKLLGGTWVPNPPGLFAAVPIGSNGQLGLTLSGGGGPLNLFAQLVFLDPAQPLGVGFTNAVRLELLP